MVHVVIVGGGVAGPAAAIALATAGVSVEILEARAVDDADTGAFLVLAPNGIRSLEAMGLGRVVPDSAGVPLDGVQFFNAEGGRVGRLDGTQDSALFGARNHLVMRAALHRRLRAAADAAGVRTTYGARVALVSESPRGVEIHLSDGRTVRGDAVIGADGVHSAVRTLTFLGAPSPRYTGIVDCGGVAQVTLPDTGGQRMVFGDRGFFGFVVHQRTAYWFSNVARPQEPAPGELRGVDTRAWLKQVRGLHCDDPDPVPSILAAATCALGVWPVYDVPRLRTWHTGRVCLIGDAAHATSPNAGQGASLALEDAAVLARCLELTGDIGLAFATFERLRKTRAERIVRLGRRLGARKVPSPTGAWLRDRMLPLFLKMGMKQTVDQYSYDVARVPVEATAGSIRRGERA